MKQKLFVSLFLFLSASILPHAHRLWNNRPIVKFNPFPLSPDTTISHQWYVKDIGDQFGFILLMALVVYVMGIVIEHLKNYDWHGHNFVLEFARVWRRVFYVVLLISIFDLLNYLLSFRQSERIFLIENLLYWLLSGYYLYKLKWK